MTRTVPPFFILLSCLLFPFTARAFTHPGILDAQPELDAIKKHVAAGEEPWKSTLAKMSALPEASLDYKATPREQVDCGSGSHPDLGCSDEKRDCQAAYLHALLWVATGDERHARKSAEILHDWSVTLKGHGLSNAHLEAGWTGASFVRAAEILRYTWPAGWTDTKTKEFSAMLDRAFLPMVGEMQKSSTNGNWEAVMIETAMSIAVFKDDQGLFDKGVARYRRLLPAYIYGTEDGARPKVIDAKVFDTPEKIVKQWYGQEKMFDGLCQETGRDLTHTQWGIGGLIDCAEIAWNQGVDLYSADGNRLMRGMEFCARYLNGEKIPADLHGGKLGGMKFVPMWEVGYNHFHGRKGLAMPETEKLLKKNRPEVVPDHHLGFGTLTHYGEAAVDRDRAK